MRTLEKVYVLDYHEVDKMAKDHCEIPEVGKDFTIIALEELHNDMSILHENITVKDETRYLNPALQNYFSTGKWRTWAFTSYDILEYLIGIGELPAGSYLIKISW